MSREHARVRLCAEGLLIEDLGSRNGVQVNDLKITRATLLGHGDEIAIGLDRIMVVDEAFSDRHECLSTLPPFIPPGESDVDDDDDDVTLTITVRIDRLSKRELEVFELLVQGHTQREIAKQLYVSVKTIETHRTHIGDKLGCSTRAELVRFGVVAGMLRPENARSLESSRRVGC